MQDTQLNDDDRKQCVFLAVYMKIGGNHWIRTGKPEIDIDPPGEDIPAIYKNPQLKELEGMERPIVEVRVYDPEAVGSQDDCLGRWQAAAVRCDEALKDKYPDDVIQDDVSKWSPY